MLYTNTDEVILRLLIPNTSYGMLAILLHCRYIIEQLPGPGTVLNTLVYHEMES